jgi:uncharacterized protein YjbJ (UPF0337 family)
VTDVAHIVLSNLLCGRINAETGESREPGSSQRPLGSDQRKSEESVGELTDDDFKKAEGSFDKLHGIIQEKFGVTKEAIKATLVKLHLK